MRFTIASILVAALAAPVLVAQARAECPGNGPRTPPSTVDGEGPVIILVDAGSEVLPPPDVVDAGPPADAGAPGESSSGGAGTADAGENGDPTGGSSGDGGNGNPDAGENGNPSGSSSGGASTGGTSSGGTSSGSASSG